MEGTIYRRQVQYCTTCRRRLDTKATQAACAKADHMIDTSERPIYWVKYQLNGRPKCVSTGTTRKEDAQRILRERLQLIDAGAPAAAHASKKITFDEAVADLINDYVTNKRRSLRTVRIRLTKHLTPYFKGRRLASITAIDARAYTTHRLGAGASNATVNRDLQLLKRMCMLAFQAGKLQHRPYIPLLKEHNVRKRFFEPAQAANLTQQLPVYMRGIAEFAYITGWRTPSEILPLEWRQVDLKAGEVRLEVGTTKNGEGRSFPITRELRRVLEAQQQVAASLRARGTIVRYVFCFTDGAKAGQRITESGYNHAWRKARIAAGCPGRIPHDFRRTAVRNSVRAGVPERVAMQMSGHRTRSVFERYNIVSPNDLRDAAARLDASAR